MAGSGLLRGGSILLQFGWRLARAGVLQKEAGSPMATGFSEK
jgi:nitrogen fixation protein